MEGNVKLRGDPGVTILIDGKPSSIMQGQGRADALQMLPADQIERVEVLTNPGAQYSPEGTGGVINLVTRSSARAGAGASGSVRANVGTGDRFNGGINWAFNSKKLALSANASLMRFGNRFDGTDDRSLTGPGGVYRQRQTSSTEMQGVGGNARIAADYDLDPHNRISGALNVFQFRPDFDSDSLSETFDGAGSSLGVIRRKGSADGASLFASGSLSWRREFAGDDHTLTVELNRDRWAADNDSAFRVDMTRPSASTPCRPPRRANSRTATAGSSPVTSPSRVTTAAPCRGTAASRRALTFRTGRTTPTQCFRSDRPRTRR